MRLPIDADDSDIEAALKWISGLIGGTLDKRVKSFLQTEPKNPILISHFRERFSLEFMLAGARKYRQLTNRISRRNNYEPLYAFLISAHRIHEALPPIGRPRFEGNLRGAMKDSKGLRPFAYEIEMAMLLMQRGWDIEFADLCGLGQFDLLARQNGVELEIECKTTSGDTGRKIHRQEVHRLADLIVPITEPLTDVAGCHLIRVTLEDRLNPVNRELAELCAMVKNTTEQKAPAHCRFARSDYTFANLDSWPEPDGGPISRKFFEDLFGVYNTTILFRGQRGHSVVALMIESAKDDRVIEAMIEQAKEAADQCTGNRAALIALQLAEQISDEDLRTMLVEPNGLHAIAHAVFEGGRRSHVDSIVFTVPSHLRAGPPEILQFMTPALVLHNPNPMFPCAAVRDAFPE